MNNKPLATIQLHGVDRDLHDKFKVHCAPVKGGMTKVLTDYIKEVTKDITLPNGR